jgi:hypothetical protein
MSNLYISEYQEQGRDQMGQHVLAGREPAIATQKVSFTATAGTSAAFNANTSFVRIHADGIFSYKVGTAPTATISDARVSSGVTECFAVVPGASLKVSAITNT